MSIKQKAKRLIRNALYEFPVIDRYFLGRMLYRKYSRVDSCGLAHFLRENGRKLCVERRHMNRGRQIAALMQKLDIQPVANDSFFYSIDCFKAVKAQRQIFGNYTIDYSAVVQGTLQDIQEKLLKDNRSFARTELAVIDGLKKYLDRCKENRSIFERHQTQLAAIESIFTRPARSFFEALQRILFYNQFLWQAGHTLNGLGHLDWLLYDLYRQDFDQGAINREQAKKLLKDFMLALHEYYWFKSSVLLGDTGQIIILGGCEASGEYRSNELTQLFIEVSKELKLPDPKVFLRCSTDMPDDLLRQALECIATGIGAPLLSNDSVVIPALISAGYDREDAYQYATSACWEPLIPGASCDQNNIASLNFAVPLVRLFESEAFERAGSTQEVLSLYKECLRQYIREVLTLLGKKHFEPAPLLSLVSKEARQRGVDLTRGGAKYNNLGLTSVGLGTVVNSMLNLQRLVFEGERYTLAQLNAYRRNNYADCEPLRQELKDGRPCFGCDDAPVLSLTREIIATASEEFKKYRTNLGGFFKFGLSSPSYISDAIGMAATFDGRKNGDPFTVHISSGVALAPTELVSFAMKQDYLDNRLNGNVVDFFASPGVLKKNIDKYVGLIRAGLAGGLFQLQMNVVDSKTLIAAKADPTLFPDLVVRVWGFSAYFNDLTEEYKNVLIARAIESERAA